MMAASDTPMALDGVVILDLTRILAGPYATQLLGDLGATILKIENPDGGDDSRTWGEEPVNELEAWLCRSDLPGVTALSRWLVDGEEVEPPPFNPDAERAVKVAASG